MARRSKVVLDNNSNKHKSRLVKAFQAIDNLEDYSLKPSGVWGSVAIIKSGGVTLKSSELDFEFDVPFDDNLESNEGEIIVYNLSDQTIRQLKAKAKITIEAGYEDDTGLIYNGYIAKVSTVNEEADRVTTIKVSDSIDEKVSVEEGLSFGAGARSDEILTTLIDKLVEKTYVLRGICNPKYSRECENGVTIDGALDEAIKTYSEACGVSTFVNNGTIYCCELREVGDLNGYYFKVSSDTGMIGSPQPFTEETTFENYTDTINGFKIDMLLQHRITTGAKIQLLSDQYKGTYYVKSGSHRFNESECITTIEVIENIIAGG